MTTGVPFAFADGASASTTNAAIAGLTAPLEFARGKSLMRWAVTPDNPSTNGQGNPDGVFVYGVDQYGQIAMPM